MFLGSYFFFKNKSCVIDLWQNLGENNKLVSYCKERLKQLLLIFRLPILLDFFIQEIYYWELLTLHLPEKNFIHVFSINSWK